MANNQQSQSTMHVNWISTSFYMIELDSVIDTIYIGLPLTWYPSWLHTSRFEDLSACHATIGLRSLLKFPTQMCDWFMCYQSRGRILVSQCSLSFLQAYLDTKVIFLPQWSTYIAFYMSKISKRLEIDPNWKSEIHSFQINKYTINKPIMRNFVR